MMCIRIPLAEAVVHPGLIIITCLLFRPYRSSSMGTAIISLTTRTTTNSPELTPLQAAQTTITPTLNLSLTITPPSTNKEGGRHSLPLIPITAGAVALDPPVKLTTKTKTPRITLTQLIILPRMP